MNKKIKWLIGSGLLLLGFFGGLKPASAMPLGTLLYRTSSDNNAYGYSAKDLVVIGKTGLVSHLYTGHVGIYIGKENGVDYIAEALPSGLVKMPAKYFLNKRAGERLIGAKIPKNVTPEQQEKVAALARTLTDARMKYDFDFKYQKGSESGQWICVGFTEKLYESANTPNPKDLNTLVYDPDEYGIDITPDGFDNYSVYNSKTGDCFSREKEFSKIARKERMLLPAPEIFGYDAGLENGADRYFFLPQTQYLQPTLADVPVDIDLESDFDDSLRGKTPQLALVFRWSLVNNPVSGLKHLATTVKDKLASLFQSETALAVSESKTPAVKKAATAAKKTTAKAKAATKTKAKVTKPKAVTAKTKTSTAKAKTTKTSVPKTVATKAKTTTVKAGVVPKAGAGQSPAKTTANVSASKKAVVPTPKKIVTPVVVKPADSSAPTTNPTVNNYHTTVVNNQPAAAKPSILIGEVGIDWIELYNPNGEAVDLADGAYRLEKTKSAIDPGIMMRFGNASDGSYPGGTEIPAKGSYLIVSEDAVSGLKERAQAIATNNNFSWGESGYTIYLGSGAISSNTDADIVDFVGFGEAKYYEGSGPAAAIAIDSILVRKVWSGSNVISLLGTEQLSGHPYDTNQNQSDFVLLTSISIAPDVVVIDDGNSSSTPATSTEAVSSSTPKIVISRISATGDDDWIDLYNDSDIDFDLALNNYRLEKAKSAIDPMILMRIGNENDGTYPGGTVIKARSYYRLVRNEASADIKATADAIATGNNFTFDGSGYTLYLGSDSISSASDVDIVDLVGFGPDASHYEGSGSAPEILAGAVLSRKVSSTSTLESMAANGLEYGLGAAYDGDDNQSDFLLIGGEESPAELDGGGYDSPGLAHLWHFNECQGDTLKDSVGSNDFNIKTAWRQGKWGCSFEQSYYDINNVPSLQTDFAVPLSSDGLSVAFQYKNILDGRWRTNISLSGPDGGIRVVFDANFTQANGLPTLFESRDIKWPADNNWHQGVFVLNGANDYWDLYLDGQKVYREYFEAKFSKEFNSFKMGDFYGYNYLDELAIWQRALSEEEVKDMFLAQSEFAPVISRPAQADPVEIHHWSFDERNGTTSADSIAGDNLTVDASQWVRVGHQGAAILHNMYSNRKMELDFAKDIKSDDLSLDFWWRNRSYPNEARGNITLVGGGKSLFGLVVTPYRPTYLFNNDSGVISAGYGATLPHDNAWHHLALTYDSYDYQLNFYVDGELKYSVFEPWLTDQAIEKLEIYNANFEYELDDLSIWQGTLKAAQVKAIYQKETGGN